MTKKELRRIYPPVPENPKGAAARILLSIWTQTPPDSVFCYVSSNDECDTNPILCYCLRNSIPLAVPLCESPGIMTARVITSLSQLSRGRFGLWEPLPGAAVMPEPSVIIVPGLLFDRDGFRLGRGGGYYDRYLAGRNCQTIGLCRKDRLKDSIPREAWDVPVRTVVTG